MTAIRARQSTLGSINNVKSTYTSNNLSTRVNLNQERTHIPKFALLPLPLKLRKSEIWDIALRAKSLTLGRIQTSLVLLSLIWDIEFIMFVIYCRYHF